MPCVVLEITVGIKVIKHKVPTLHSSQGTLHCPVTLNQGRLEIGYDAEIDQGDCLLLVFPSKCTETQ